MRSPIRRSHATPSSGKREMLRGDFFRVQRPRGDPKRARVFVVVSRQFLIDSAFSTVICAPVFSRGSGVTTEVPVGIEEGLKHDSVVACDGLMSLQKSDLSDYVGTLRGPRLDQLDQALAVALGFR